MNKQLRPYIDRGDVKSAIRELFVLEPNLPSELSQLFFRDGAPHEPGRIFDYLFVAVDSPACGTEGEIAFRPRELAERAVLLRTWQ